MLKRNIIGEEIFNINDIVNKNLSIDKYNSISSKIGIPFDLENMDSIRKTQYRKTVYKTNLTKMNDTNLYDFTESRKISNINTNISHKSPNKIYTKHPLLY